MAEKSGDSGVFFIFFSSKLLIILLTLLISFLFAFNINYAENMYVHKIPDSFLDKFSGWDGQLYIKIAEQGYAFNHLQDGIIDYTFYPFYPLLIRSFNYLFHNSLISGLFISYLTSFIGIFFLYKLIRKDYNSNIALKSILYILIFPAAIFLSAVYTEALFLMLVVMSFYFAREKSWPAAGILGFLASLTRVQGIFLFFPLLYMYLKDIGFKIKKISWNSLFLLLIPLGTFLFFLYLWIEIGNFFASIEAQKAWGRTLMFPLLALFKRSFMDPSLHRIDSSSVDALFGTIFLISLVFMYKKIRREYWIYSFFVWVIPLLSGSTLSLTRFLILSFPTFIYFALLGEKSKAFHYILIVVFSLLLAFFSILFTNWYWAG